MVRSRVPSADASAYIMPCRVAPAANAVLRMVAGVTGAPAQTPSTELWRSSDLRAAARLLTLARGRLLAGWRPRCARLHSRATASERFGGDRGLPERIGSPKLNAKLLELAQTKAAMYDAFISEMEYPQESR